MWWINYIIVILNIKEIKQYFYNKHYLMITIFKFMIIIKLLYFYDNYV